MCAKGGCVHDRFSRRGLPRNTRCTLRWRMYAAPPTGDSSIPAPQHHAVPYYRIPCSVGTPTTRRRDRVGGVAPAVSAVGHDSGVKSRLAPVTWQRVARALVYTNCSKCAVDRTIGVSTLSTTASAAPPASHNRVGQRIEGRQEPTPARGTNAQASQAKPSHKGLCALR